MKPQVSIIIPVFNQLNLTRQCLDAIQANTPHDLIEVIVVDNASTDGTLDYLNQWKGPFDLRIIPNRKNQGYAKANNQGAGIARGDYILLLNNDTEPQKNWLAALLDTFRHRRTAGAVGAKLLYPDGTIQHAGIVTVKDEVNGLAIHPFHIGYKKPNGDRYDEVLKVCAVTGACLMMPIRLYRDLGGLDESYWNGHEDVDLCFKILEAGFEIYFQPQSVIIHHESQSGPERWRRAKENQELLNRKWAGVITCPYVLSPRGQVALNNGVTIIMVTFNSASSIVPCIEALSRTLRPNDEVIIVDNASDDDTAALVRSQIANRPRFKLLSNSIRRGFAAAANQGAKAGRNPYIAFLNPDTLVGDHWIERLQHHLMPHKTAAAGPVSNVAQGLQKVDGYLPKEICEFGDLDNINQKLRQKHHQQCIETKLLLGFCLMLKRNVYDRIGGMDGNLIPGIADLDLSWRIRTAGYQLVIAKD